MGSSNIEQPNSIAMENFNPHFLGLLAMSNGSFSDNQEFRAPNHLPILHDQNSINHHPNHVPFYDPVLAHFNFSPSNDQSNPTHEFNDVIRPLSDQAQNYINSTPLAIETGSSDYKAYNMTSYSHGGKKRKRNEEKESEKPREVVHVRAKRGQATDSHSLAERLRREKINEKLRSLQDLVPGCYKTMGMAVMLDVIINYVRSLQNQIEFLSMKLSAASLFYDFNSSEMDVFETMQSQGISGNDQAQVMERMVGEGYGGLPQFQSWPL